VRQGDDRTSNAVFDAVENLPYVDRDATGIAGASYGGYAVDWIIGHDQRFKAAVSHDGVFNLESMALATEELWFDEWESGAVPHGARRAQATARCSPHLRPTRSDAHARHHQRAGFPRAGRSGAAALHRTSSQTASRARRWSSRTKATGCSAR
jgi:hypothetical protein